MVIRFGWVMRNSFISHSHVATSSSVCRSMISNLHSLIVFKLKQPSESDRWSSESSKKPKYPILTQNKKAYVATKWVWQQLQLPAQQNSLVIWPYVVTIWNRKYDLSIYMYTCLSAINSLSILPFFSPEVFAFTYKKLSLSSVVTIHEWDDVLVGGSVRKNITELELLIKDRFWRAAAFVTSPSKLHSLTSPAVDIVQRKDMRIQERTIMDRSPLSNWAEPGYWCGKNETESESHVTLVQYHGIKTKACLQRKTDASLFTGL